MFLLLVTLGMGFTGQVLRFDQDAYWGLGIGASIVSRVPLVGPWLVTLMLGGPIIAGATLSRFFALHVFVIPGLLIGFVGLHRLLVLKLGINEWPMPGRIVRRATYLQEYHELTHEKACRSCPTRCGRTSILRRHSSFDCRLRRPISAPSVRAASRIRRSFRRRRAPISSSCGSTRCSLSFPRRGNTAVADWAADPDCCAARRFPFLRAKARRVGSAGRSRSSRSC